MKNPLTAYFNKKQQERQRKLDAELLRLVSAGYFEDYMLEQVSAQIGKGAKVSVCDPGTGNSLLHIAAGKNYSRLVRRLLDAKADVEATNAEGLTPLLSAAGTCAADALDVLLVAGANPQATQGAGGKTAINTVIGASSWNMPPGVRFQPLQLKSLMLLTAHGAVPDATDRRTIWLMKRHLFPAVPDMIEIDKFCQAGIRHNWPLVEDMLAKGMKADAAGEFGAETALMSAAMCGETDMVDKLLKAGADPNRLQGPWIGFDFTATPLHAALHYRHFAAAAKLLDAGGDPRLPIRSGECQPIPLENFVGADAGTRVEAETVRRGLGKAMQVRRPLHLKPQLKQ